MHLLMNTMVELRVLVSCKELKKEEKKLESNQKIDEILFRGNT